MYIYIYICICSCRGDDDGDNLGDKVKVRVRISSTRLTRIARAALIALLLAGSVLRGSVRDPKST